MTALSRAALAGLIDHTLLAPQATADAVVALCAEAAELGTCTVCVSPTRVALAVLRAGRPVASVVGFPSGAHSTVVKVDETERAVADGAAEIDVVIDLGAAADGDWAAVGTQLTAVRAAAPAPVLVKVIIESALLDPAGITAACRASEAAGCDFVKTSTGFHPAGGASLDAVRLMAATVGGRLGVKASGGIRTTEQALAFVDAGATRLGLSASRAVLDGLPG